MKEDFSVEVVVDQQNQQKLSENTSRVQNEQAQMQTGEALGKRPSNTDIKKLEEETKQFDKDQSLKRDSQQELTQKFEKITLSTTENQ